MVASPVDDRFSALIDDVLMVGLGPAFYETLIDVAHELEAEIDLDAIDTALARARVAAVSGDQAGRSP